MSPPNQCPTSPSVRPGSSIGSNPKASHSVAHRCFDNNSRLLGCCFLPNRVSSSAPLLPFKLTLSFPSLLHIDPSLGHRSTIVVTLWNHCGKTLSALSSKAPSGAPTNVHKCQQRSTLPLDKGLGGVGWVELSAFSLLTSSSGKIQGHSIGIEAAVVSGYEAERAAQIYTRVQ